MTALDTFCATHGLGSGPSPRVAKMAGRPDLCALFAALGYTRGAEVGVWKGGFSQRLCEAIPGLHLTCVDPWAPYADYRERKNDPAHLDAAYAEARARLQPFSSTFLRMTSMAAAHQVADRSLDFVYIDGNHEKGHVLADLAAWSRKVRHGGILAGHDYRTHSAKPFIQVEAAVNEFTRANGIEPWFVLASERTPSYFWVVS